MSTTISGSDGVSKVQDGVVVTDDLAAGAVTAAKLSGTQTGSAPVYGCRAWCVFDGTLTGTNAPTAGGNVTSVTRNSTGDYTINFTTAMQDANYAVSVIAGVQGSTLGLPTTSTTAPTSSAYRFRTTDSASTAQDSARVMVVFYR